MRWPLAPILTILSALGSVLVVDSRIQQRQESSAFTQSASSAALGPTGSSSASETTGSPTSVTSTIRPTSETTTTPLPTTPTTTSSSSIPTSSSSTDVPATTTSSTPVPTSTTPPPPPPSTSTTSTTTSSTPTSSSISASVTPTTMSSSSVALVTPATTLTFLGGPSGTNTQDFTVTAIVADPSGTATPLSRNTSKNEFFSNTGAVAGTFVVVGLFTTGVFFCIFFWARRKYRRYRNRQIYEDEYWQFNRSAERGTTPEPTFPTIQGNGSLSSTPALPSPSINMVERHYGDDIPSTHPYQNTLSVPVQAEPGEFNPYNPQDAAYAFTTSDLHIQDPTGPTYGYQVSQDGLRTPEHPYATAGQIYRRPSSSQSFHRDDNNGQPGVAY